MPAKLFGRRVHSSWLISALSVGVLLGAASAYYLPAGKFQSISWLALAGVLGLVCLRWRYFFLLGVMLLAGGLIGVWRGSLDQLERQKFQAYYGQEVVISGIIRRDIDIDSSGKYRLYVSQVAVNSQPLNGTVWASSQDAKTVLRGDKVKLEGILKEGFGSFSASMYRAKLNNLERPLPGDLAGRIRDNFANQVRRAIPEPESSLGLGYLVGQRRYLSPELDENLRVAGLTHVVVASGFHLSTIVRFVRRRLERISRFLATTVTSTVMLAFLAVTGLSPSMVRASLVTALSLLAWYYGRKFHPLVLLPFVASISVLVTPSYIWGSLGWQLSFMAFSGVMILAPLGQRYFFGSKKPKALRQLLGETIAAQIATWPILVYGFSQFSTLALVANILVLPLVPLAMLGTFLTGISQALLPFLADSFGVLTGGLLGYMIGAVDYIAALPFAVKEMEINLWQVGLVYLLLGAACIYMSQKTNFSLRNSNLVE